ncbi:MAG: hypothetical protein WC022_00410 [Parcubacteria group bacterium]
MKSKTNLLVELNKKHAEIFCSQKIGYMNSMAVVVDQNTMKMETVE